MRRDPIPFMEKVYGKQSRTIEGHIKELERIKQNQLQLAEDYDK
ncbi:MAG: hypothetical protein R2680_06020 [Nitrososphaeraceae archaeon]